MNALRHGLRSREFGLLPEEDPAEWAEHLADLRRDLAPVDPTEEKLVTALAVAMWKEIRADRTEAGVLTAIPVDGDRGRDLGETRNALSLGTAIRYAHRRRHGDPARPPRLPRPPQGQGRRPDPARACGRAAECTNDFPAAAPPRADPAPPEPAPRICTNEFPSAPPRPAIDPLAALRARIRRLLDGAGPPDPDQRDLAAAMLAARLPGAAPYHGPIDLALLDQALAPLHFDAAALAWLAGLASAAARPTRAADPEVASRLAP